MDQTVEQLEFFKAMGKQVYVETTYKTKFNNININGCEWECTGEMDGKTEYESECYEE